MYGEQLAAVRTEYVRGAGQTGVKAVQRAQDFQRLIRNGHASSHESGLVGAELTVVAARSGVPGRGHDTLVVFHLPVPDGQPVPQRTARSLGKADAPASAGQE